MAPGELPHTHTGEHCPVADIFYLAQLINRVLARDLRTGVIHAPWLVVDLIGG